MVAQVENPGESFHETPVNRRDLFEEFGRRDLLAGKLRRQAGLKAKQGEGRSVAPEDRLVGRLQPILTVNTCLQADFVGDDSLFDIAKLRKRLSHGSLLQLHGMTDARKTLSSAPRTDAPGGPDTDTRDYPVFSSYSALFEA